MKKRQHIPSSVLAEAAKWAKPKLRKRYTYGPRKMTVKKYLKTSGDKELQQEYASLMKTKKTGKRKKMSTPAMDNKADKVYHKFESMNNFSNLRAQNMEFAEEKNKQRKMKQLETLDSLAWESVAIPENDRVFGSADGQGHELGVGALQVIDSKKFFEHCNIDDFNVEEYTLDSNLTGKLDASANATSYDDRMGVDEKLDINVFNNEANELFKLIQFSLHKKDPTRFDWKQTEKETLDQTKSNEDGDKKENAKKKKKKKLRQRATMKQEKKLYAQLNEQYSDDVIFRTQQQIEEELLDKLNITMSAHEYELKAKAKLKYMNAKKAALEKEEEENKQKSNSAEAAADHEDGPPLKKRKMSHESNENVHNFRKQIENLHEKQNIEQVTQTWNGLLHRKNTNNNTDMQKQDEEDETESSNPTELLSHFKAATTATGKTKHNNNNHAAQYSTLHPTLLRGIAELGFPEPTQIQKEVIPVAMDGRNDVLIAAATGSGKTLAFGIPIINDLLHNQELNGLDCALYGLIITPTRELAIQIEAHLKSLCKYSTINCVCIVGGMSLPKQRRLLSSSPEIVIATPGRLWQFMQQTESLHLRDLTKIRYLVLDEADRLLSSAHYAELHHILGLIKTVWKVNDMKQHFDKTRMETNVAESNDGYNLMEFLEQDGDDASDDEDYQEMPEHDDEQEDEEMDENQTEKAEASKVSLVKHEMPIRRQTFVVSATLTLESINRSSKTEAKVPIFANLASLVPFQASIKVVDQTPRHRTSSNVLQYQVPVELADKDAMLACILCEYPGRNLVFANTIGTVKRITMILKEFGLNVYAIHSQQQQRQRLKNLDRFVKTKKCTLICTDVCARGLDVPSVDNVIHFQVPLSAEDYIHRTGRVGRRESKQQLRTDPDETDGNSFLLVCAEETKLHDRIILALKRPEGLNKLSINERLLVQIRRQIAVSKKIASLLDETARTHRKTAKLQKMAQAAGIELDEINCRALKIMKTDENVRNDRANARKKYSKTGKHKTSEYGINRKKITDQAVNEQVNTLRKQLRRLKSENDLNRPKSSYLTKNYVHFSDTKE